MRRCWCDKNEVTAIDYPHCLSVHRTIVVVGDNENNGNSFATSTRATSMKQDRDTECSEGAIDAIGVRVRERLFERCCSCSCARDTRGCGGFMVGHGRKLLGVARTHASEAVSPIGEKIDRLQYGDRRTAKRLPRERRDALPTSCYSLGCRWCAVDTAMMRCQDDRGEASRNPHGIYLCPTMCELRAFPRSLRARNTEEERVSSYRATTLAEQTDRICSATNYTRSVWFGVSRERKTHRIGKNRWSDTDSRIGRSLCDCRTTRDYYDKE